MLFIIVFVTAILKIMDAFIVKVKSPDLQLKLLRAMLCVQKSDTFEFIVIDKYISWWFLPICLLRNYCLLNLIWSKFNTSVSLLYSEGNLMDNWKCRICRARFTNSQVRINSNGKSPQELFQFSIEYSPLQCVRV